MDSANFLELDELLEARETDLDNHISEFIHEKSRLIKRIEVLSATREKILQTTASKWDKIVSKYEYKQQRLYEKLKMQASNFTKLYFNQQSINNYSQIIKKSESLLNAYDKLDETYSTTIDALEKLKEFLVNNYGASGYVDLNEKFGVFQNVNTNWGIISLASERVNSIDSEISECKNWGEDFRDKDREKKVLTKLINYIDCDNSYRDEIYKINALVGKYSKLKKRLPNDKKRMHDDLETTIVRKKDAEKTNEIIREAIQRKKQEISNLLETLSSDLREQCSKQDDKIKTYRGYIEEHKDKISEIQGWILERRATLSEAYNKRRELAAKAHKFDRYTHPREIDSHEWEFSKNEKTISWANEQIQKLNDMKSPHKTEILKLNEWISSCKTTKETMRKTLEIFVSQFKQDYDTLEADTNKIIRGVLYDKQNRVGV